MEENRGLRQKCERSDACIFVTGEEVAYCPSPFDALFDTRMSAAPKYHPLRLTGVGGAPGQGVRTVMSLVHETGIGAPSAHDQRHARFAVCQNAFTRSRSSLRVGFTCVIRCKPVPSARDQAPVMW